MQAERFAARFGRFLAVVLLGGAMLAVVAGCGGGGGTSVATDQGSPASGALTVRANFPSSRMPSGTVAMNIVVTGEGLNDALTATLTQSSPSHVFSDVPIGTKLVRADALSSPTEASDGSNILGFGLANATVLPGQQADVQLTVNSGVFSSTSAFGDPTQLGTQQVIPFVHGTNGPSEFYISDSDGVKLAGLISYNVNSPNPSQPAVLEFDPPLLVLKNGELPKSHRPISAAVTSSTPGAPTGVVNGSVDYLGVAGMIVPGGTFKSCAVLHVQFGGPAQVDRTMWLDPGTGPVFFIDSTSTGSGPASVIAGMLVSASGPTVSPTATNLFGALTTAYFPVVSGRTYQHLTASATNLTPVSGGGLVSF